MPRSKNKNLHNWGIEYEGELLAKGSLPRRAVETYMGMTGDSLPQAVADMLTGYAKLIRLPLADFSGGTTGGAAATPRTTEGRAGVAGLRVDEERQTREVRDAKRRTPKREAA